MVSRLTKAGVELYTREISSCLLDLCLLLGQESGKSDDVGVDLLFLCSHDG
jgi:hypothetical protein